MTELHNQFDNFADDYVRIENENKCSESDNDYFRNFPESLNGLSILDLGCGPGTDLELYLRKGAKVVAGLDGSAKFCEVARKRLPQTIVKNGRFDQVPFPFDDESFDIVCSKWALQASDQIAPIIEATARVLKTGGKIIWLTMHPIHHFMEMKRENHKNFFDQVVCSSHIYGDTMVVRQRNHALTEYFSDSFFKWFTIKRYSEGHDSNAEMIEGCKYPNYFLVVAERNSEKV